MKWKWKLAQAAEIRWWRHYLANKTPEQYLRAKADYWQRVIRQMGISLPAGARVLDAGCGPAGIFMVLREQQVSALDPLLDRYAATLPHFAPEQYPWVQFITGKLETFRTDRPYDQIFCLNAINHVSDIGQALQRLVDSLAEDGTLWLSTDAHRYSWLCGIFQWLPGDILHPQQYTLDQYRQLLEAAGLEVKTSLRLKPGHIFEYHLLKASRRK